MLRVIFAFLFFINFARAETPVEFVIHFAPGGPSDMVTRTMLKHLPNNYYANNKPGAGGKLAVSYLINKNGLMLATMSQIYVANTLMNPTLDYKPNDDLEVIASVGDMPTALVCKRSLGFRSFSDLTATDKSLSFGIAGYGSSEHLATELLLKKLKGNHIVVPYPAGGSASVVDLLGGSIDCTFASYPRIKEFSSHPALIYLMSSVNVGLSMPTWKQVFIEPFPFMSYLAIVIPRTMSYNNKESIKQDVQNALSSQDFINELIGIGIFPAIGIDEKSIQRVLDNNARLFNLIKQNNLRFQ